MILSCISRYYKSFFNVIINIQFFSKSASVSQSTSARPDVRSVTPAGSSTVWSTASSLMARCPPTRPSEPEMTVSILSSPRPELGSTSRELCLWTWSQLLSVRLRLSGDYSASQINQHFIILRIFLHLA